MSLLPPEQRQMLHKCIVSYIRHQAPLKNIGNNNTDQDNDGHVIGTLAKWLEVDLDSTDAGKSADGMLLPRKWNSIVRLQRRIMELEKRVQDLSDENEDLRNTGSGCLVTEAAQKWIPTGRPAFSISAGASVTSVKLHPELPLVFAATDSGKLLCYDLMNYTMPVASVQAHMRGITSIDVHIDDDSQCFVATASKDLHCKVFRLINSELQLVRTFSGHEHIVSHIKIWKNATDTLVASCSRDLTCKIGDVSNGYFLKSFQPHAEWVRSLDIMGEYIITGSNDCTVRLSHWPTGRALSFGIGHDFPVEQVKIIPMELSESDDPQNNTYSAFNKDYLPLGFSHVVSCSRDNTLRIWQVPIPRLIAHRAPQPNPARAHFTLVKTLKGHSSWVRDIRVRGNFIISCSDDRSVRVWDLETGETVREITDSHTGFANCIDTDCGGLNRQLLVSGGADGKVIVYMR